MSAFVTAGAGFLLAVLWFDLMFDVQVARGGGGEEQVGSIAAYYARVTTAARPMNRLVAGAMLWTLAAIVWEIARPAHPVWAAWASLALALVPIALAGSRTVPRAVALGARRGSPGEQLQSARLILREHLVCAAFIAALIGLQLSAF